MKKKLVVLSGAGISAESGIATFRDANGLWEGHDVMEVASLQGWVNNMQLVLAFYNKRRKQASTVQPNRGHQILAELEDYFDVTIITQNVDHLHEKAGSSHVIHLHGELFKARSTKDPSLVYDIEGHELNVGDVCELGAQLRPHIVWFGELVPMIEEAVKYVQKADVFLVIGTSLNVYPAASLIDFVDNAIPKYVIDPKMPYVTPRKNLHLIEKSGSEGMLYLQNELLRQSTAL